MPAVIAHGGRNCVTSVILECVQPKPHVLQIPRSLPTSVVKQRFAYGPPKQAALEERDIEVRDRSCARRATYERTFEWLRSRPTRCSVKEVIQPQVPLRLPCYDFAPVTALAFGRSARVAPVPARTSGAHSFHGVTGGVYKARERIHRGVADPRLLAIPASCGRVADHNPN